MSSPKAALDRYQGLLTTLGRGVLNSLYPDDIENYIIVLELTNSLNSTEDLFIFPINPQSIKEVHQSSVTIKRTYKSVTTIEPTTFTPTQVVLNGNFGRTFKVLVGREVTSVFGIQVNFGKKSGEFFSNIKTGYGCIRVLESIFKKSKEPDFRGYPRTVNLYNLISGNNYIVKPVSFTKNQDISSNMIWNYTIQFEALGRIEDYTYKSPNSIVGDMNVKGVIQNMSNKVASTLSIL